MKEIVELVSRKIKKLRTEQGLTLKELGAKTDLSVSFLSQVERGQSSMTLVSLSRIAAALGVTMDQLVTVDEECKYINTTDSRTLLKLGKDYTGFVRLSGTFTGRKLEGILLVLDPHHETMEETSHEGEEFYYIVKGRALFILDGSEYAVGEGESIHYPSSVRHKVVNRSDVELVMVSVVTPPIF